MSPLLRFKAQWCHPTDETSPIASSLLESVGLQLGITFPADYVAAMTEIGPISTTLGLLHVVCREGSELHDLSALHHPGEIVEHTEGWQAAGMPVELIAIGSDCMGNSFCFDRREQASDGRNVGRIYFWDHDFDDVSLLAGSFNEWLESYLDLPGDFDSWREDEGCADRVLCRSSAVIPGEKFVQVFAATRFIPGRGGRP